MTKEWVPPGDAGDYFRVRARRNRRLGLVAIVVGLALLALCATALPEVLASPEVRGWHEAWPVAGSVISLVLVAVGVQSYLLNRL